MKDLIVTWANQIARLLLLPVVMMALPRYLSIEEQGYWFSMISLVSVVAFADMGLSNAIMQCAAHEFAAVLNSGDAALISVKLTTIRLKSLLCFSLKRILLVNLIVLPTILLSGFLTFKQAGGYNFWLFKWIVLCIFSSIQLIISIILAFYEGCNSVQEIQGIRFLATVANLTSLIICVYFGIISFACIYKKFSRDISPIYDLFMVDTLAWSKELTPLLKNYSLSWVGGYFMFQLFTPITFKIVGPVEAGKVGLTISLITGVFNFSNIWSAYQLPGFAMDVARRDRLSLHQRFDRTLILAVLTFLIVTALIMVIYLNLPEITPVRGRILDLRAFITLGFAWFFQLLVHNMAIYLRAFKQDPLVLQTLGAALHTAVSTVMSLKIFGTQGVFIGFLTVYIWFVPAVYVVFRRQRNQVLLWD